MQSDQAYRNALGYAAAADMKALEARRQASCVYDSAKGELRIEAATAAAAAAEAAGRAACNASEYVAGAMAMHHARCRNSLCGLPALGVLPAGAIKSAASEGHVALHLAVVATAAINDATSSPPARITRQRQ
jgi:hypothetical protein